MVSLDLVGKYLEACFKKFFPFDCGFIFTNDLNLCCSFDVHNFETCSPISLNFHWKKAGPRSRWRSCLLSRMWRLMQSTDLGVTHLHGAGLPFSFILPLVFTVPISMGQTLVPNHLEFWKSFLNTPIRRLFSTGPFHSWTSAWNRGPTGTTFFWRWSQMKLGNLIDLKGGWSFLLSGLSNVTLSEIWVATWRFSDVASLGVWFSGVNGSETFTDLSESTTWGISLLGGYQSIKSSRNYI